MQQQQMLSAAPPGECSKLLRQLNDSAPIIKLKRAKNFAKSDAKDETFLFNVAAAESIFILSRKLLRTVCVSGRIRQEDTLLTL